MYGVVCLYIRSPGGFLHRVGDEKRTMSSDYLARLFQQRSQTRIIRFDEQTVPDAGLEVLSSDLWERFRTSRTGDVNGTTSSASSPWPVLMKMVCCGQPLLACCWLPRIHGNGCPKPMYRPSLIGAVDIRPGASPKKPINWMQPTSPVHSITADSRRLPIRGKKHEDRCHQGSGPHGLSSVRHDRDFRSNRECGSTPRLFNSRIEDQAATV